MIPRWTAGLLLLLPAARGGELRFLNSDGGPLPGSLQSIAPAFSTRAGDLSTDESRAALAEEIVVWANARDHPVFYASVEAPDKRGVTVVRLTDGKTGNISIEGGRHLPVERIARQLRLQSGEPLRGRALQEELDWLQRNPFHRASLAASPGAGADTADIAFTLSNDAPVSLLLGYDNHGVAPLGESRYRAAVLWGNAFGQDHQITLQATTGSDPDSYRSLAGEWVIPFSWRHELRLTGAWAATSVTSELQNDPVESDGSLWGGTLRYVVPRRLSRKQTVEFFAGFDFRHFDTDVTFGGTSVFDNAVEVGNIVVGASGRRIAGRKQDSFSLELVWSPGYGFAGADDAAYQAINPKADADYFLVRGAWQSHRPFANGWHLVTKAGGQAASAPLLPGEDYNLAGAGAVRGYRERSVRGRHGALLSAEILTPALPLPAAWRQQGAGWQLAAFADGGWASPSTGGADVWLASAGLGVRARSGRKFTFAADLAFPLHKVGGNDEPRLHVIAQLNF